MNNKEKLMENISEYEKPGDELSKLKNKSVTKKVMTLLIANIIALFLSLADINIILAVTTIGNLWVSFDLMANASYDEYFSSEDGAMTEQRIIAVILIIASVVAIIRLVSDMSQWWV